MDVAQNRMDGVLNAKRLYRELPTLICMLSVDIYDYLQANWLYY